MISNEKENPVKFTGAKWNNIRGPSPASALFSEWCQTSHGSSGFCFHLLWSRENAHFPQQYEDKWDQGWASALGTTTTENIGAKGFMPPHVRLDEDMMNKKMYPPPPKRIDWFFSKEEKYSKVWWAWGRETCVSGDHPLWGWKGGQKHIYGKET